MKKEIVPGLLSFTRSIASRSSEGLCRPDSGEARYFARRTTRDFISLRCLSSLFSQTGVFFFFLSFPSPNPRPAPPPHHGCGDPPIPPTHQTHTYTQSKKNQIKNINPLRGGRSLCPTFHPKKRGEIEGFCESKNLKNFLSRALQLAACLTSDAPTFSRVCARRDKPRCTREPACSSSNPGTYSSPAASGTQPACCKPDRCRGSRRSRWHPRQCHRS